MQDRHFAEHMQIDVLELFQLDILSRLFSLSIVMCDFEIAQRLVFVSQFTPVNDNSRTPGCRNACNNRYISYRDQLVESLSVPQAG
jgi:hypothetical protein